MPLNKKPCIKSCTECEYCYVIIPYKGCNHNCPDPKSTMQAPADQDFREWIKSLTVKNCCQCAECNHTLELQYSIDDRAD